MKILFSLRIISAREPSFDAARRAFFCGIQMCILIRLQIGDKGMNQCSFARMMDLNWQFANQRAMLSQIRDQVVPSTPLRANPSTPLRAKPPDTFLRRL